MKRTALFLSVFCFAACGDDDDNQGTADASPDVAEDASDAGADTAPDTDADATTDATTDTAPDAADAGGDAVDDTVEDTAPACTDDDAPRCSEDGFVLETCEDGAWVETHCMRDQAQLCEDGACVDPWTYGAPTYSACGDDPLATEETLAEKAAYYDDIAERLHVHPEMGWMMSVTLETEEVSCEAPGGTCTVPVVDADSATFDHVARWHTGENDGLWNGLYIASQAFRYAATGSEDALDMLRLVMEGQVQRMEVTGVPGVFTRQLIPPDVDGIACPESDDHYTVDLEKDDNRWVQIRDDGCAWVVDRESGEWMQTDHCDYDEDLHGYCWLDNVSQDEYAGHMFALAAIWLLVDDEELKNTAADLIGQVGRHLVENELTFVDWDGRVTEHGKLYANSLAGFPGFLAAEALGFVRMAAVVTGDPEIQEFYDECLLQRSGQGRCMSWPLESGDPYHTQHLPVMGMYVGNEGCKSNYNNHSMVMSYLWVLLQFETDPEIRTIIQDTFEEQVFYADNPRALGRSGNAWYNYIWASTKAIGPDDAQDVAAVEAGNCALQQFAATGVQPTLDASEGTEDYCEGRLGRSQSELPIPVAQRCPSVFMWWWSPYDRSRSCTEDLARVHMPADYLVAYWMARYYGYIGADD